MSYIEKEKLIKADIASIENRVRHAFNQGYNLGFNDGKKSVKPLKQEPTTKNNLAVDAVSRNAVINQIFYSTDNNGDVVLGSALRERIARLPSVTPQEPMDKCKWIKYDYRTMCPKEHIDIDSPYWRMPENRMETLKYCPYCGKEIEVEK